MAEVVGAFYAVETVVEGAVAGALAVSGATAPLHAHFHKIKSPSEALAVSGSTSHTIKNKIYILGGSTPHGGSEDVVHVVSLQPDFGSSRTEAGEPLEVDYSRQEPVQATERRPLQPKTSTQETGRPASRDGYQQYSWSRSKHGAVSIEDKIYVLGGISVSNAMTRSSTSSNTISLDTVLAYNTLDNSYTILSADPSKCTEGVPEPRYSPSCTSSPYPPPISVAEGKGPSLDAHGTIFLHGGYDVSGHPMNDTWTFDIGTRAWHKFPTVVEEAVPDSSVPGQIAYVDGRLWYINASAVMHLELAEHDPQTQNNDVASQDPATMSTGRVGTGQWQVVYPPPSQDPAAPAANADPKQEATTTSSSANEPSAPTAHIVPIRTGAGRTYLVTLSTTNPQSMHTFQIPSASKTATALKDTIRDKASDAITNLPDSWKSGKHEWSKMEVIQSSKQEGEIERPDESLTEFAVAAWEEYGDKFMLWGGETESGGVRNEGWIVSLD